MGTARSAFSTLAAVYQQERPPSGQAHSLFLVDGSNDDVNGFRELVLCPSDHGAHIISYENSAICYKVKHGASLHEELTRLDLYALEKNRSERYPFATMEKVRTVLTARRGAYSLMQAWHVTATTFETDDGAPQRFRTIGAAPSTMGGGVSAAERVKKPEACGMNMYMKVTGRISTKSGVHPENWTTDFKLSDPDYRMQIDTQGCAGGLAGIRAVRIFHEDKLVCTGRIQSFDFMNRARHERPFVGVQLKQMSVGRSVRGARADARTNLRYAHRDILPLLLVIAWAEEMVHPPMDLRHHFVKRMRRQDTAVTECVTTDIGWDTIPVAEPLQTFGGSPAEDKKDDEEQRKAPLAGSLEWDVQVPPPPASAISSHRGQKVQMSLKHAGSLSVNGI